MNKNMVKFVISSDEGFANYIICFLRLIASAELQSQPDFYMNFLPDVASIQAFCRKVIMSEKVLTSPLKVTN